MAISASSKFNKLRFLDRKLGIPLCNFFYLVKKTFFLHGRHKFDRMKVKKILVIKIWGMGSIILASPVFQNLRQRFPEAEIWFLTKEGMENIYPTKFFDRIITIKIKGLGSEVWRFFDLVRTFRQQEFDLVIDLEIVSRYSALLSYLCGAKTKVGFEIIGQNKDRLYDYKSLYHEGKHISQIFLGSLDVLGFEPSPFVPAVPEFSSKDEVAVASFLTVSGIHGRYVIININASELALERRLPLKTFEAIISNIRNNFPDTAIVLMGAPGESVYVSEFKRDHLYAFTEVYDFSGRLKLTELFVLIKKAALVISNDSGPSHVAAAFSVPLVVFFGPETPVVYRPIGEDVTVFYADLYCSPCISVYKDKKINCTNNNRCLTALLLDDINRQVVLYLTK